MLVIARLLPAREKRNNLKRPCKIRPWSDRLQRSENGLPSSRFRKIPFPVLPVVNKLPGRLVLYRILPAFLATAVGCAGSLDEAIAAKVNFNFEVRPLLSDRCFSCHGPDEKARKGKLRLDTLEGLRKELDDGWQITKPGDVARSELIRRIETLDEEDIMPPANSHLTLAPAETELLKRWVAEGAEYQAHWSLLPVGPVAPPVPQAAGWVRNPLDQFVLARLEERQLRPAPEAAREVLIRRLALDLTGLPPTLAEIDGFLKDQAPDSFERLVEHYLDSPAYGERMAMDWLDLARYADTYGYQNDIDRDMSPWRDWVIRAFNENLPYDQFITWQIAGDLLPNATDQQRLATAFNRLHRQTNEGGSIDEEFRNESVVDRVITAGTAFLGLTLECARCHDHKFDPITQRDFYSLAAFFNSIDESGLYSHFTRATPTPAMLLWPEEKAREAARLQRQIAETEQRLATIAGQAESAFQSWLQAGGRATEPQPVARFAFDSVTDNATPDSLSATAAKLVDGPKSVPGRVGNALRFSGDNQLVCAGVRELKRTDPFSFSLWLKPAEHRDRAVILHQSRAWSDSGSRGFELVLDHGKPFFALIHFWPGNAIAVRAKQSIPLSQWSQVAVTYDGSSRAAGIRLYRDGVRLETEIVRDRLTKDIVHRAEWEDMDAGKIHLTLAGRFRDSGFQDGEIDELEVYDVALTDAEVKLGFAPDARGENEAAPGLFDCFLARQHEPAREALAALRRLREQENQLVNDVPEIMVMEEMAQPRATHLLKRGAYDAPGDVVGRDTPQSILPFPRGEPRNRLGLAHWLTSRQNPLTARVVVNRVWRIHFGRGIVASQEDFGSQGRLPSHPEMLDWLAGWFMDHQWDVKALHRMIVESATYRQGSNASPGLAERDPDNLLLARGPKHRLLAEQIRDGALAASGLLNRTVGGPSVKPYQPAGLWEQSGTGKTYIQDHGDKLYRRSLYTFWRRTAPPPAMLTFDATSREVCSAKRETTATPLQALVLLNDPQFIEAARVLAEKLLKEHPEDSAQRNRAAFRALTGRAPDETEAKVLAKLFAEQCALYARDEEGAKALLATGESPPDPALDVPRFAAMTTLVSAIMNFDEFVTKR